MKQKSNKKCKVLICMSGGVDSSVAAALLLQDGYDVTGAFMKQWSDTKELSGVCSWKEDRRDALRVAAYLGIPLLTLDFEKEYKEWVMGYMFAEYTAGRTPNPDVVCNKWIKFGAWMEKAREMGFEYLATGHYARVQVSSPRNLPAGRQGGRSMTNAMDSRLRGNDNVRLIEAKDKNKDQTYFLHQLNQEQLQHTLFPIGGYTKPQVRALARKFKLPTAERVESMGICFVGEIPMKDFLQQKIKPKPGRIVLSSGEAVGEHEGLAFYTIGQRHNLRVEGVGYRVVGEDSKPLFVVGKNLQKNELIVGYENDPLLWKKEIEGGEVNWVSGLSPQFPLKCKVRLRHRQTMQNCVVETHGNASVSIKFAKPQKAATPGQFAVFYKKGECLGGGVIV